MTPAIPFIRRSSVLAKWTLFLGATFLASRLGAQNPTPPTDAGTAGPPQKSEVVQLNPFEVVTDKDEGYSALNSNSLTRFNTELSKMPISADVFDQQFMSDVNATTVEDMIQAYTAGAGNSSASPDSSAAQSQPGDRSGSYVTLRGLFAPTIQRDGFMPAPNTGSGVTRSFNIERAEVIMGPQALLYGGGGGAGGVVNLVSKQASLDRPAHGSFQFYLDQYGTKTGTLDYGVGNSWVGVRISLLDGTQDYRRQNIGGPINGEYVQLAFRLGAKSILRVNTEQQFYSRIAPESASLVSTGSSGGVDRNGDSLHYLLASNQAGAVNPVTGAAYASGAIDNGLLNWGNVDSYEGWWESEITSTTYSTATLATEWSSWLSTEVAVGYQNQVDDRVNNGITFDAPGAGGTTDPFNNVWSIGATPTDTDLSSRTKGIRLSAVESNDIFGGRAHTQTVLGMDYVRNDSDDNNYAYWQADSNFNVVVSPTITANNGRTEIAKQWWPVANGYLRYPLWSPRGQRITVNGVNYVRMLVNPVNPALISPLNPAGVSTLGGSSYSLGHLYNRGIYGANNTEWFGDRLETLLGFRVGESIQRINNQGFAPPAAPSTIKLSEAKPRSFNVGANFKLLSWLRPYAEFSDSFDPPLTEAQDPYGNLPKTSQGIGEELGFKVANADHTLSGSLAAFHTNSKNEEYLISSTLLHDINPSGLNGQYGAGNQWVNVNRESQGLELKLTAQPGRDWRMRLSASYTNGKIANGVSYAQLYNDQFNENSQGQVTYANGTVVYVNGAATSAGTAKEVSPTTVGAIPLTTALMSTSTSPYFANPITITGQITGSSAVGTIIKTPMFASTNGPILTGLTGLPISKIQINASSNANNAGYIAPPGIIPTVAAGDLTTGYPVYTFNFTNVYQPREGWMKGFMIGGTVTASWDYRAYYYFPTGLAINAPRVMYYFPNLATFNGIFGYSRKFKRINWSTQLNINNMFNHYDVIVIPNALNGYASINSLNATWNAQPRQYVWTNTLRF